MLVIGTTAKKQLIISHIRDRRIRQSKENALAAKDVFIKRVSNTDARDGVQLADLSADVLDMLENIRRSGADPKLQSEEAVFEEADIIMSPAVKRFLVYNPHKLDEDGSIAEGGENYWIEHPNEFAEEYGINSVLGRHILNDEEKDELKKMYSAHVSINQAKIRAAQDADGNLIFSRTIKGQFDADPENGIEDDIFSMIEKSSIDPDQKRVWTNWVIEQQKKAGAGPAEKTDPKALFEAGKIINAVKNTEYTEDVGYDKLSGLFDKLDASDRDTKINQLTDAVDTASPVNKFPAKKYIDSFDNIVFEEASESVEGMIYYDTGRRILEEFARKNPDATPEQWAKQYSSVIQPFLADWTFAFFRREWGEIMEGLRENVNVPAAPEKGKKPSKKSTSEMLLGVEPHDIDGFRFEITRINNFDPELAQRYYDKYKSKWPEVFE